MISVDAIQTILGIKGKVDLNVSDMLKTLSVSFYPYKNYASDNVVKFSKDFEESLVRLGVKIIPYSLALEDVPLKKRFRRFLKYLIINVSWLISRFFKYPTGDLFIPFSTIFRLCSSHRIKKGITVVCVGEQAEKKLVMQYISNFKTNSIITIVDLPPHVTGESDFSLHFDTSMSLFSYHMTNIIIAVGSSQWITYNFNASHPHFKFPDNKLDEHITSSIIPKIAAPISPHRLDEFHILKDRFNPRDRINCVAISDMSRGASLFAKTKLFPNGKSIDELPFRNNFHKFVGKLHLDNRNGMSFGFLAYQLPSEIHPVIPLKEFRLTHPESFHDSDIFVDKSSIIHFLHKTDNGKLVIRVPNVWVMTLRSGAKKTNFNEEKDILKIGLINGEMYIQLPENLVRDNNYKPSFDTKVILAHAVCNALIATLSVYFKINSEFAYRIQENGISISHWHGYFNKNLVPKNMIMYGENNLHVSCSSPQSAIYAMQGKFKNIFDRLLDIKSYVGDIHIEPHHGVNVTYPSLVNLGDYILNNPGITELGNKFL